MIDSTTRTLLPSYRTPLSTYSRHVRYTVHEFPVLLDSSSISSQGWTQIATAVHDNYALFDGFVIIHGTDSLAYTSSALSFMLVSLGKPVIVTGSQASIFALQTDAVGNLLGSIILAGTFMIPEVGLFFHHKLFRGNRTTKTSTAAFDAFASPNCTPLAELSAMGAHVDWALVRRPTSIDRFMIQTYLDTAHVACIRLFPGIKPAMLDAVLHIPNIRGLILETFGAGNAPEGSGPDGSLVDVITDAISRDIVVVNVSQCPSGAVAPLYALGTVLGRAGVVFGADLTTEAALTKLAYLLALRNPILTHAQISAQMAVSIRGEMTAASPTRFSHPSLPSATSPPPLAHSQLPHNQAFDALASAISRHSLPEATHLLDTSMSIIPLPISAASPGSTNVPSSQAPASSHPSTLLDMRDSAGNSALHLAVATRDLALVRMLLQRGASVHVRNRAGDSVLGVAKAVTGNDAVVHLLEETGALLHEEERERERHRA